MSTGIVTEAPIRDFLPSIPARAAGKRNRSLQILFLVSAHNGLSQRAAIALRELGHEVAVAVVDCAAAMEAAVAEHDPELIVCPFLKTLIPKSIWLTRQCLVVHPGPPGDRGPSSLDWAVELGMREWGVTVLVANGEFDAGDALATRSFPMREAGKASLYRNEVRHAAIDALLDAVGQILGGVGRVERRAERSPDGHARPVMTQSVREIDWRTDSTDTVIRKIRAAEGHPGVLGAIGGREFHLFGVHRERILKGRPGELIAQRSGAVCRATVDGAVWVTHLRQCDTATRRYFKLPATRALELAGVEPGVPEIEVPLDAGLGVDETYREITYEEHARVGYLRFDFYNGAMSSEQCRRLREAYAYARTQRGTEVIVLLGGDDYFCNGIHLSLIEAATDPAAESWRNLVAIDDLVRDILLTDSHVVISALGGDAAAGGVPLALAADYVVGREDIVLNPYYQHMGGLYGSEYWTYLLPRRIGATMTTRLTQAPFNAIGTGHAVKIGLLDATFGADLNDFQARTRRFAEQAANDGLHQARLAHKQRSRRSDERAMPLSAYRSEELARCRECFFGPDRSYDDARHEFVYKLPARQKILRQAA